MIRTRLARRAVLIAIALVVGGLSWQLYAYLMPPLKAANSEFVVEPYLQLGRRGDAHTPDVLFAALDSTARYNVEVKLKPDVWSPSTSWSEGKIALSNLPALKFVQASLPPLPDNQSITYRVLKNGESVYQASINPIKTAADAWRFDVAGDIGDGSAAERDIARGIYESKPDLMVIPGDIVYGLGRTSEYLNRFFPVFNADRAGSTGVPLMRSTLFTAAPGNHDTACGAHGYYGGNLDMFPDGLGYFLWWHQPLNGPDLVASGEDIPKLQGSQEHQRSFRQATGSEYPRETNFSFDYANAHWTVIDANDYVNWTHVDLRKWLANDLDSAKNATWKFVVCHQPPFSSDTAHFNDQQIRLIADILQDHGVDVVFSGHVHNYQATYPLRFKLVTQPGGAPRAADGTVAGQFDIDKRFDGKDTTHPHGVIYVTTGGGGAELYGHDISRHKELWQPFTRQFYSLHSFTRCDIKGRRMKVVQITDDGKILDEFAIDK